MYIIKVNKYERKQSSMNKPSKYFTDTFAWACDSKTDDSLIITKNNVRLSLLTERLLRVEVDPQRNFIDAPTQTVVNRNFCKTS